MMTWTSPSRYERPSSFMAETPAMITEGYYNSTDDHSLRDILIVLWKKKWFIAAVSAAGIAAGLAKAFTSPPIFLSQAVLVTRIGSQSSSSPLYDLAALAGVRVGGGQGVDPSLYLDQVIMDEGFVRKIADRKWFYKGDSVAMERILGIKADTAKKNCRFDAYRATLDQLRKGGYIALSGNTKVGTLTLTTSFDDPLLAFEVNKYVIRLFGEYFLGRLRSQAKEKRAFIEERLAEVKAELERSENVLTVFRERNSAGVAPQLKLQEMRLSRNVNINQEIYLQLERQYETARIEEKNDQPLMEVIRSPEMPITKSKPDKRMILMMGFMSALIAGCTGAVAWHWMAINFFRNSPGNRNTVPGRGAAHQTPGETLVTQNR